MKKEQGKTIGEWLKLAKKQGYEWADIAIAECNIPNALGCSTLSSTLGAGFEWGRTKEGHAFWLNVFEELQEQGL